MSYSVSEIITLGIGTPSDIPSFILFGLNTNAATPPTPGSNNNALTGISAISSGEIEEFMGIVGLMQGGNIAFADILTASKLDAAGNTAAVVTVVAPTTFENITRGRVVAHKIYWSYSNNPTGGKITLTGGAANFELDITTGGPGSFLLGPYVCNTGTNLVATLAAAGGVIVGKVNVDYVINMFQ